MTITRDKGRFDRIRELWIKITRNLKKLVAWHDRLKSSGQALVAFLVAGLCNVIEFYEGWISLFAGIYAWWMGHKQHATIQAIHRIRIKRAKGHGFTWHDRSLKRLPRWLLLLEGRASGSGLIWDAFTVGVSRVTGEPVSIWLKLYGTNEGVGHYYYRIVQKWGDGIYGTGHFGLMPDVRDNLWGQDYRRLDNALRLVGAPTELGNLCRPVDLEVSEGKVEIYDPESGRDIFMNLNEEARREDFLVFGPYPTRKQQNGAEEAIEIIRTNEQNEHNRLSVKAKDIYNNDIKHVVCRVSDVEGNGWHYQHKIETYELITVPKEIKRVNVSVCRGGYGTLTTSVDLGEMVPLVEARLAPLR